MARDGTGTYNLPAGQPVVTGTIISSTTHNTLASDIATALTASLAKDGQTTPTANLPMGTFRHTGVGNAAALTDYASASQAVNSTLTYLTSVAGTNTITGTASITPAAYAAGQKFHFTPANTNTGATTLNVSSVGAKNVFWNGVACVGGELRQNIPAVVEYDGTQFNVVGNGFNAPFLDSHAVVVGSADSTKKLRFEVDGFTTATTRVITPQDYDWTIGTVPQNSQSAAYTTVLSDAGKHILHPTADNNARTFTIDSNANVAYPIGTAITFVNQINTVTIAITSDTLTLAGAGTTGSRTLAANGIATALKIESTGWVISGTGLT